MFRKEESAMMPFEFLSTAPFAKKGIPASRIILSGGRTAADLAAHGGLTAIRWFGNAGIDRKNFFKGDPLSVWVQNFRPYVAFQKKRQYFLELHDTAFYPFGYDSSCETEGFPFRHRFTVLNNALLFELETDQPDTEFSLMLSLTGSCALESAPGRVWKRPADSADGVCSVMSCTDTVKGRTFETGIAFGGSGPILHHSSFPSFPRDYFRIKAENSYAAIALVFGNGVAEAETRLRAIAPEIRELSGAERKKYHESVQNTVSLNSPDPVLNSFVRDFPEVVRSMAVKDIPGALCASNSGYWIWGWDSMVHSDSMMLAGMKEDVLQRLRYYRDTADPQKGIFHALETDGRIKCTMEPAPQTIYIIMLYNFWRFTQDAEAVEEFYAFSCLLMERAEKDLVGETGLCRGLALYPDTPSDLGQDGDDISSFNNSILFQAARCLSELARRRGRKEDARRFRAFADGVKSGFRKYLFDPEEGYFYDSISAKTFVPRKYYPLYAILRLTPFADELVEGIGDRVGKYMLETFTEQYGAAMFGRESDIFYADGCQLGMYSTVIEGFYRHLVRDLAPDSLQKVIRDDWRNLELSEANACEPVNMRITTDHPGKKQLYAASSYHSLIFGELCGLEFLPDALHLLRPAAAKSGWSISNLKFSNAVLDIVYQGSGGAIRKVILDGETCSDAMIPYVKLSAGHHRIEIITE